MSAQAIDDDKRDEQTKKSVTVNAYADPDQLGTGMVDFDGTESEADIETVAREFATAISKERDFFEETTQTSTEKFLEYDGTRIDLDWSSEDDLEQLVSAGANLGDFEFVSKTNTTTEYKHSLSRAGSDLREEFVDDLDVPPGLTRWWSKRFEDDQTGETAIRFSDYPAKPRRLLRHQAQRTDDDRFESDDPDHKRMSVQWIITLGPASEAQVERWSRDVVGAFATFVGRHRGIETVRIADCTETLTREGDCFDL